MSPVHHEGKKFLSLESSFWGELCLLDDNGKVRLALSTWGAEVNNRGSLSVKNKTGNTVVYICSDENGDGFVNTYNNSLGTGRTLRP